MENYDPNEPSHEYPGGSGREPFRSWITWSLLAANVLVFAAMVATTGTLVSFPVPDLFAWGGNRTIDVAAGDYWRPFTAMFLHAGIIHLGFNMWVLLLVGPFMEQLFGRVGFLLLYLLAGLAGNILGMLWRDPLVVAVGASGAIFGLYGGLLGFLLMQRHRIAPEAMRPLLQNGLFFLGINLVLGFTMPQIDMAGHLFGALGGFVGAVATSWAIGQAGVSHWILRSAILLALCTLLLAAMPFLMSGEATAMSRYSAAVDALLNQEESLKERYYDLVEEHEQSKSSDAELAAALETDVLIPWKELRQAFPPLESLPERARSRNEVAGLYQYLALWEEALELRTDAWQSGNPDRSAQADDKIRAARKILDQIEKAGDGEV
jgi:rhomboid protease GluP